jgi:O-antigen/teichoic acid export membrane protein
MARGSALSLALSVCAQACAVGVTLILARRLGAADVGRYAQAQALLALIGLFALGGLRAGLTRFIATQRVDGDMAAVHGTVHLGLAVSTATSVLLGGVLLVLAHPIGVSVFHDSGFVGPLRIVAVTLPFATIADAALAGTQGFRRMRAYALIQLLIEPTLRIALTAGAIVAGLGIRGALISLFFSNVVAATLAVVVLVRMMGPLHGRARYAIRELLAFSMLSWSASLATTGLIWADTVMLGIMANNTDVGVYNVATRIVMLAVFVMTPINQAVGPRIAHVAHAGDIVELRHVYAVATGWIVRLSLPAFIVLVVFPRDLLRLFGDAFVAGAAVTIVLALGKMVDAATGPCAVLLNMSGRPKYNLIANVLALVLNIALNLVLIPAFGVVGAAIAWAVSLAVVNGIRLYFVHQLIGTLPFDTGTRRGLYAALAALAVAAAPGGFTARVAVMLVVYVALTVGLGFTYDDRVTLRAVSRRLPFVRRGGPPPPSVSQQRLTAALGDWRPDVEDGRVNVTVDGH